MKRRTKQNVGAWPNMRDDTLKAIADELSRARKKHPKNSPSMMMVENYTKELRHVLTEYEAGRGSASQIYAVAATVAAMAIRVLEEGSGMSAYRGNNSQPPNFELTP